MNTMWPFKKKTKRPNRMYAAIRLAHMFIKDGMKKGVAYAVAIHQVTWDYDNWTKEDDEWFWKHLKADEQSLEEQS